MWNSTKCDDSKHKINLNANDHQMNKRSSLLLSTQVVLLLLVAAPCPTSSQTGQTQYLLFQIFTYGGFPNSNNAGPLEPYISQIVNAINTTGTNGRKLGFAIGPLTLDHTPQQLQQILNESFALAKKYNVAIAPQFDDAMFYINRTDLWTHQQNVEWVWWNGTQVGSKYISWYPPPLPLAPQMCYNSPEIRSAVRQFVVGTISQIVKPLVAALPSPDLFAGFIAGSEARLHDDSDTPPIGYCALTNEGYTVTNPPSNFNQSLDDIVYDWVQWFTQQFVDTGNDSSEIYTHVASGTWLQKETIQSPLWAAFNTCSRGGFTVYGNGSFEYVYQALAEQPQANRIWAITEGSNLRPDNVPPNPGATGLPDIPMSEYLAKAFDFGASRVTLYGWQSPTSSPFYTVLSEPSAIEAYQQWLSSPSPTSSSAAGTLLPLDLF